MEKNTDLAYQALDYIREHPQEWDQRDYFCGTTACFAGRVCLIAYGSELATYKFRLEQMPHLSGTGALAAHLLGWTEIEASSVFSCFTKDFAVLEQNVKSVLNGEVR